MGDPELQITFPPHALEKMEERGIAQVEVSETVRGGDGEPALHGRTRFVRVFNIAGTWCGKAYNQKEVTVVAIEEAGVWIVVTVLARYFTRPKGTQT